MIAHKRLIFILLSLTIALLLTQMLVFAQDKGTPDPTSATDYPLATLTTTPVPTLIQMIDFGEHIEIRFDVDDARQLTFTFNGKANQVINIDLDASDNMFPCMYLYQPNDHQVYAAENISTDDGRPKAMHYITLPKDGVYSIKMWACGAVGTLNLHLSETSTIPLTYDSIVEGTLSPTHISDAYRFKAQYGQQIIVRVKGSETTPQLHISCIKWCNDSVQISDDRYQAPFYRIDDTDDHIVIVKSNEERTTRYQLTVNLINPVGINYGTPIEGMITPSNGVLAYQFPGEVGDTISIHANSEGQVDTRLVVLQGADVLVRDDDSGSDYDPEVARIVFDKPAPYFPYLILVLPFQIGDSGKVKLSLDQIPIPSLDADKQTLQLTEKSPTQTIRFMGIANQRVRLNIHKSQGGFFGVGINVWQQSVQLSQEWVVEGDTDNASIEFVVPQDGEVRILVNNAPSTIELTLQRLNSN